VIKPVNRHILVDYSPQEEQKETNILLPDDYKPPEEEHIVALVLSVAEDVSFSCKRGDKIVLDKKMLQEIKVKGSTYYTILENYVIGVIQQNG